ncbi:MAG: hypothetical protein HEQ21_04615 [Blastomonas sp.]|uniref:hypothetical protein n=1 Tax=Blastomonas sp. TaxID=1909299 RepID=UPI002590A1F2|nr:hypothetical protein [Blastomonas sp.]MCO5792081.1 hypothetical protein [Blastomonas sp.]
MKSEAYRSLGPTARSLLFELAMIENSKNNGSLYLSVRDAADRLGMSDLKSVTNAFDDLEDRGLIQCTKPAHFEVKAADHSRARCWKLTWVAANRRPPCDKWRAFSAPHDSKADLRARRGMAALQRYGYALNSHRLPVLETITE